MRGDTRTPFFWQWSAQQIAVTCSQPTPDFHIPVSPVSANQLSSLPPSVSRPLVVSFLLLWDKSLLILQTDGRCGPCLVFLHTVILGSIHSVIHCRASLLLELSSVLLGTWATLSLGISWWTRLVCSSWCVRIVFSGTWEHRLPLWHTDFIFFGFIPCRRIATSCSIFYI